MLPLADKVFWAGAFSFIPVEAGPPGINIEYWLEQGYLAIS